MKERWKVGVVAGEDFRSMLMRVIPEGCEVETLPDNSHLLETLSRTSPDLIFIHLKEQGSYTFSFIREIKLVSPQTMVIVVGKAHTPDVPISAFRSQVYDMILWPASEQELKERMQNALLRKGMGESKGSQDKLPVSLVHQLRNPLGAISGHVQQLLRKLGSLSEKQMEEKLRQILSSCIRIEESLNEFLSVQRGVALRRTSLEINTVLEGALALLVYRISQKNITVEKSLGADIPRINATSQHLLEAFMNIMANSVEAMKEGGKLFVESKVVEGYKGFPGKWVCVTLRDTGCGIREEDLPRIFTPFFTTKEEGNVGMGLPIVKEIVESHHGRIEVNGNQGRGTRFSIYFPVEE